MTFRSRTLYQPSYNGLPKIHDKTGGRGRIRTSVARGQQIYSLSVLTTHPPVQIRESFSSLLYGLPCRVKPADGSQRTKLVV